MEIKKFNELNQDIINDDMLKPIWVILSYNGFNLLREGRSFFSFEDAVEYAYNLTELHKGNDILKNIKYLVGREKLEIEDENSPEYRKILDILEMNTAANKYNL